MYLNISETKKLANNLLFIWHYLVIVKNEIDLSLKNSNFLAFYNTYYQPFKKYSGMTDGTSKKLPNVTA